MGLGAAGRARRSPAPKGHRAVFFPDVGAPAEVPVHDHYALTAGTRLTGPAIVEQRESTAVIGPHDTATMDADGSLMISLGGPR
jgi:N-methylhydantoinase A